MKLTRVKRFLILFITLTLVSVLISAPAFAIRPQSFNAWIASALTAAQITVSSVGIPIADALDNLSNPPSWIQVAPEYTYSNTDDIINEYMDRSVIKIRPDTITIDGVEYQDVWLSHDAAEAFRVNSYDAITAWNIASESNGTFVSGAGTIGNVPVYEATPGSGVYQSSMYLGQGTTGDFTFWTEVIPVSAHKKTFAYNVTNNVTGVTRQAGATLQEPYANSQQGFQVRRVANQYQGSTGNINDSTHTFINANSVPIDNSQFDLTPFDFDWVSGVLPPDEPLPEDYGMLVRLPVTESNPLAEFKEDYPEFTQPNGVQIDTSLPELMEKIDDLIDVIIPLIPVIDVDYNTYEQEPPAPDPEPIPEPEPYPDPLPDPSIELIDSTLKDIIQSLKNIFDSISIGNSIQTAIKNLADKIKWALDDIKETLGDIANKIELGNIDWFSDIVDAIKAPFMPWLGVFKAATGIWSYVVQWFTNILQPLTFFIGVLNQSNSIFMSPIYAAVAATIVIAIYRRFGR